MLSCFLDSELNIHNWCSLFVTHDVKEQEPWNLWALDCIRLKLAPFHSVANFWLVLRATLVVPNFTGSSHVQVRSYFVSSVICSSYFLSAASPTSSNLLMSSCSILAPPSSSPANRCNHHRFCCFFHVVFPVSRKTTWSITRTLDIEVYTKWTRNNSSQFAEVYVVNSSHFYWWQQIEKIIPMPNTLRLPGLWRACKPQVWSAWGTESRGAAPQPKNIGSFWAQKAESQNLCMYDSVWCRGMQVILIRDPWHKGWRMLKEFRTWVLIQWFSKRRAAPHWKPLDGQRTTVNVWGQ